MRHASIDAPRAAALALTTLLAACGGADPEASSLSGGPPPMTEAGDGSSGTGADATGVAPTSGGETSTGGEATSTGAPVDACEDDADCEGDPDGPKCVDGACTTPCAPGDTKPCYSGPDGTVDVGACARGVQTCSDDGMGWSACAGEVLPAAEACDNQIDDDCDGEVDDDEDLDGDGWGACAGDCCDADGEACFAPEKVNPGAVEYVGNDVDDDCDGQKDEAPVACDEGLKSDSADPLDYARALDLCSFTEESPADPKDRRWGVISAKFTLADGKGAPAAASRALRDGFGSKIKPQKHARMAVLSSGHAADASDLSPAFAPFEGGKNMQTTSPPPADWLAANAGKLPNPPGCEEAALPAANDPVMLTLRVRVPTNARSFAAKMYFFSAEYPEWVCSKYNDFFVALVDSQATGNPADKNVAVYDDGQTQWPIGVNLAMVAELFTQCEDGPVGCAVDAGASYAGCTSTAELAGTGFDAIDNSTCSNAQKLVGGGTGWLTLRGNVEPGETMELRLAVWDSGGHILDSLVLLDGWEWSVEPAQPGVTPG
jgi:hypothetical protein